MSSLPILPFDQFPNSFGGGGGSSSSSASSTLRESSGMVMSESSSSQQQHAHNNTRSEAQKERVQTACTYCRYRKVKCDGGKPSCGFCTHMGREQQCVYAKVSEEENQHLRRRKRELRARRAAERLRAQQDHQQQQQQQQQQASTGSLQEQQPWSLHRQQQSMSSVAPQRRRRASVPKRARSSTDVSASRPSVPSMPFEQQQHSQHIMHSSPSVNIDQRSASLHHLNDLPLELSNTISPGLIAFLSQQPNAAALAAAAASSASTSPHFPSGHSDTSSTLSSSYPNPGLTASPNVRFDHAGNVSAILGPSSGGDGGGGWPHGSFRALSGPNAAAADPSAWGPTFALPAAAISTRSLPSSTLLGASNSGEIGSNNSLNDYAADMRIGHHSDSHSSSATNIEGMGNFVPSSAAYEDATMTGRSSISSSSDGDSLHAAVGYDKSALAPPWATPSGLMQADYNNVAGTSSPSVHATTSRLSSDGGQPSHTDDNGKPSSTNGGQSTYNAHDVYVPTEETREIIKSWRTRTGTSDKSDETISMNPRRESMAQAAHGMQAESSAAESAPMTNQSSHDSLTTSPRAGGDGPMESSSTMGELRRFFYSNDNPFNFQPVMPLAMSMTSPPLLGATFGGGVSPHFAALYDQNYQHQQQQQQQQDASQQRRASQQFSLHP